LKLFEHMSAHCNNCNNCSRSEYQCMLYCFYHPSNHNITTITAIVVTTTTTTPHPQHCTTQPYTALYNISALCCKKSTDRHSLLQLSALCQQSVRVPPRRHHHRTARVLLSLLQLLHSRHLVTPDQTTPGHYVIAYIRINALHSSA
jgi:hypothetical protein